MSEKVEQQYPSELGQVYAQLKQQDVEQFYTGYQWWKIQQRIIALQAEIGTLHQQIDENAQYMQEVRPPAVALATLARLQANGVHDLELLDRMLERGEGWLDLIVQRLDYCEQLEFIPDNYTQWCEHALEGAYDWIDSMRGADALALSAASSDIVDLVSVEATEELLLRKLTSEEEEEEEEEEAQPLSPPMPAIEEMQPITEEILPTVEEFENIAEDSLPEETDAIASSASAFVEEDNAEILLPDEAVADEQETEFQDGDFAPALEIQLPTEANAEADLSQDIHVHPLDETSYAEDRPRELLQQETEIPLLVETTAIGDSSLVTEEQHLALDSPLPEEIEVEVSSFERSVEADSAQVPIDQVPSPEDTSVSATQETPLPTGADSSAASDELHNEQVAETVPVAEVALPVETNAEVASPVEAAPEAVHTAEGSISQRDIESAPAQHVKPRGFWRWLLALFRN